MRPSSQSIANIKRYLPQSIQYHRKPAGADPPLTGNTPKKRRYNKKQQNI
jgi:hypothetical protein